MMQLSELLETLHQQGKELDDLAIKDIQHDLEDYEQQYGSLSIKIFSTLGAWIAAVFFLTFIFLLNIFDSSFTIIVLGGILIGISLTFSRASHRRPALEPFTVVFNIVGQVLMGIGLFLLDQNLLSYSFGQEILLICTVGIVVEVIVLLLSASSILRFGAVIVLHLCILGLLWQWEILEGLQFLVGISAWLFMLLQLYEAELILSRPKWISYLSPVGIGLASSFLFILTITINKDLYKGEIQYWWISSIFLIAALLYFCHIAWRVYTLENFHWLILISMAIILAPTLFSPGIAASLLVLVVAFQRGQKTLIGIGIAFLTVFISSFYYNLHLSLLLKSGILFLTGIFFLSAYFALKVIKKRNLSH